MTSALSADLARRYFDTTTLTDHSLVADTLIFSAGTFEVFSRSKYLLTEKSTTLWTLSTIVNRLGDQDFPI